MIKKIKSVIKNNFIRPKVNSINTVDKYLSGESFDVGLIIKLEGLTKNKGEFLLDLVKDKKIIHVGCVDHLDLIKEKIKEGTWLHSKLDKITNRCLGVDINTEGIEFMKKDLGYDDLECVDIADTKSSKILDDKFDYMLLAEILEHVYNPLDFLTKIRENYKNNIEKIVITVPNGFCYSRFKDAKNGYQNINSDHKTEFSYYTLAKILYMAGFDIENIMILEPSVKIWHKFVNFIFNRKIVYNPSLGLGASLIAVAKFNDK